MTWKKEFIGTNKLLQGTNKWHEKGFISTNNWHVRMVL